MLLTAYRHGTLDINANATVTQYDGEMYLYNSLAPHPLSDWPAETTLYLRHAVLLHILVSSRSKPTIIKTHNAHMVAGDVHLIPHDMTQGAVYIVRDPRDVAVSFARHTKQNVDNTITTMGEEFAKLQNVGTSVASWLNTWSYHVKSWDKDAVTRVRYEDLKESPRFEFARILNAFGLKLNKPRLNKAVRLCELDNLKKQEAKEGFIENGRQDKFFGQGKGWQNELTEKQVRRIEMDHGEMMESLGYRLEYL